MNKHLILTAALLTLSAAPLSTLAQTAPAQTTTQTTTAASTFPSGYTRAQLDAVAPLLADLRTLQTSRLDLERGRVVVVGLSAVDRLTLLVRLKQAELPTGVVDYQTSAQVGSTPPTPAAVAPAPTAPASAPTVPAATTLPRKGAPLAAPHRAAISGPAALRAGTAAIWSFTLTSTGTQAIRLAHGACDVRFEVISAAGAIVRPDPKDTLCTMQLVTTDVGPGETREVQTLRWEGRDAQNRPLPAGTYTLRAVFNGAGVYSDTATLQVTVQ